jgi:UDPglucose 6-dehydrogenase/GDP-mannose 6-dehydrogenase
MLENVESPPLVIDGRRMLDKSGIVRYEGIGL